MDSQRKLVESFKQFVNTVLFKHFKDSEETMIEWNYFSSLLSQDPFDLQRIDMYLNVVSPSAPQITKMRVHSAQQIQQKKTNSGIFKKEGVVYDGGIDASLNKTVGGMTDRIKFTSALKSGLSQHSFQLKNKSGSFRVSSNLMGLIESMQNISNYMSDNHTKMQLHVVKPVSGVSPSSNRANVYQYSNVNVQPNYYRVEKTY